MVRAKPLRKSRYRTSVRARETSRLSPQSTEQSAHLATSRLISSLRNITIAVQVFPFIYSALFIILFAAYSLSEGVVLDVIDYLAFVSPIVIFAHLVYSRMLKMCKWHRAACVLPLLPQSVDLFDTYVYHMDHNEWMIAAATILVTTILFFISFYKVFFSDEGRICR